MKTQNTMYWSSNMKHMWLLHRLEICLGNIYLKNNSLYVALLTKTTLWLSKELWSHNLQILEYWTNIH